MLATDRQDIATALSGVESVTGSAYRPMSIGPGSAWPQMSTVERGPGRQFGVTWRIFVALSGDEKTATTKTDELLEPLVEALEAVVFVDTIDFIELTLDQAGSIFGLQITARSE